jgi:hypothetical protein
MNSFYVYEHWRPDKDICFYVGKGKNKRAWDMKNMRNPYFKSVVSKLLSLGLFVDVRIISKELTHEEAITLEMERIAYYGIENLTNMTKGGDGMANPTEKTRQKMSASQKTRFENPEERKKIAERNKNRKVSEETRKKLSIVSKGKKLTDEHKNKLSISAKKRGIPQHVRDAHKKAVTGKSRPPFSAETLLKMSEAAKLREKLKHERKGVA